ncbi:glutathione S-transferase omega-1-like [Myxocyprinus asiaticus]|uniref:glutathione S-transferase omega-1-like n=1 Tax=Myxocyprinus asiaticus TaxID=70543 RepID=UPI002223D1CC|nr:glutathione S-transferase omega-1-like [Myxocyprinus asiaticus]
MASSQKVQGKESAAPGPVPDGHLRLYSMRFCPFAQRARMVLNAKGIKYDTVNINLKDKPNWYLEKNPAGTVPALETPSGQVIYESLITCEYLDEVYPEKKLIPSDPFERAQQKMLLENYSKVIPYFYKISMGKKNGEDVSTPEIEFKEKLSKLNQTLANKKTIFFGGDSITMIDYMIWPWFERIEMMGLKHCLENTPELRLWIERMLKDPSVKATMFSTDDHKVFFDTYMDGKPNFDYGL